MQENERTSSIPPEQTQYFGMQAEIDHTKHIGGQSATLELIQVARISQGDHVLEVGCGVGFTTAYLVEQIGCRVTAVDLTPRMIERAQERALRRGIADRTTFRQADAQDLPFEDDLFDVAIAESVLSFAPSKERALSEMVRVTRPGGRVAITEAIWIQQPPSEMADVLSKAAGLPAGLLTGPAWTDLLNQAGLNEIVSQPHPITAGGEARDQFNRLGLRAYLRTLGRSLTIFFRKEYRSLIRDALGQPPAKYFDYMGYGVFAGQKPSAGPE